MTLLLALPTFMLMVGIAYWFMPIAFTYGVLAGLGFSVILYISLVADIHWLE